MVHGFDTNGAVAAVNSNLSEVPPLRQTDLDKPVAEPEELLEAAAHNNRAPRIDDPLWARPDFVDIARWNKAYPFQLLVLEAKQDAKGQASYEAHPAWCFTLPVPPEGMTTTMPFAITTHVTMGGVVEEHNGAPLRMIELRGTTGLLPGRGRAPQQQGFNVLQAVGAGTLQAVGALQQAAAATVLAAAGAAPANPNTHDPSEFDQTDEGAATIAAKTTGYYQHRKLVEFLEKYARTRKTAAGRNLRLALAVWKDEAVYLVTPQALTTPRGPGFEYPFTLSLKAWRRVRLERAGFQAALPAPLRRDPNALARVINTLSNARRVVQGLSKVAAAAVGDVERLILEPLREAVLFCKDASGVAPTLAEVPDALKERAKAAWIQASGAAPAAAQVATTTADGVRRQLAAGRSAANETKDMVTPRAAAAKARALAAHPAGAPFAHPQQNIAFFEAVPLGGLQLGPALTAQVAAEKSRVRALRRSDFEQRRDRVRAAADRLAVAVGAGDATYQETYGVVVSPIKDAPTAGDWEALWALNAAAMCLDSLAATGDNEPTSREDAIEVMAGLARRSGIAFQVPTSKFLVPFPYGGSLEAVAARHLGDPQRWHEIAALNGLQDPYVDEVGFDLPLLVNGAGQEVVVAADVADRLYVGQLAYVWSTFTRRTRRRIVGLRLAGDQLAVELDGAGDMESYQTQHAAKLSAFLPDTINSQQLIYIPSDQPAADDSNITKSIPGVDEFDPMVQTGGVDLLLDDHNDLVVTPDGDTRLAAGLANIVQAVRVMLSVERGHLLHHPDYGLPISVGMSTAEITAAEAVDAIRRMLAQDPTFARVDQVQVVKDGGVVRINIQVVVAGTTAPTPISFAVG